MAEWDFPALSLLQFHPHLLEKEALASPILGESPGAGCRQCCLSCFPPCWHLPASIARHREPLSQRVLETQSTSQGFLSTWHGHGAEPKPSPEQWPVMISCVVSLCTLMGQGPHLPIPAGVCSCPSFPAEPFNTRTNVPSHPSTSTLQPLCPAPCALLRARPSPVGTPPLLPSLSPALLLTPFPAFSQSPHLFGVDLCCGRRAIKALVSTEGRTPAVCPWPP